MKLTERSSGRTATVSRQSFGWETKPVTCGYQVWVRQEVYCLSTQRPAIAIEYTISEAEETVKALQSAIRKAKRV